MSDASTVWVRLVYTPSTGRVSVEGDLTSILQLTEEELTESDNPVSLLPAAVAAAIAHGGDPVTDPETGLVIVPGDTRMNNSVTLIRMNRPEIDIVSDIAAGVVGFSPDGTILRWNRRMSYLFGPREKDVIGRKAADVLPAPVLYNWTSVISSAHMGHEVRIEFRPSGEKRVEGILSQGGTGVTGLFFDSTEGYKTGKRLRALNRLNQAYLQSTTTGLLLLDSQLRILLSNQGFGRISGERGSFIGQQLHDVLPEESYKWIHTASERLYGEESSEQTEILPFRRRDGSVLTLKHILRVVRNEMNRAVNYVCLFQDMTELTGLRLENSKLRTGLESIDRLSSELSAGGRSDGNSLCGELLRMTGSDAAVLYSYDKADTLCQSGCAGNWPKKFMSSGPGALGLPASVWSGTVVRTAGKQEMGKLSSVYSNCMVVPIGSGARSRGFILLCNSAMKESDEILGPAASLTGLMLESRPIYRNLTSVDALKTRNDLLLSGLLGSLPFPASVLTRRNVPVCWNPAMERITGLTADSVTPEDVQSIIDPDGTGLSLDSLSVANTPDADGDSLVWRVRKKDGTLSRPYRWHVSILEQPQLFKGDYGFMLTGLDSGDAAGTGGRACENLTFLRTFSSAILSGNEHEVLEAVWKIAYGLDCCSGLLFFREGIQVASFPEDSPDVTGRTGEAGPLLVIDGAEYEVRPAGNPNTQVLESVCELVTGARAAGSVPSEEGDLSDHPVSSSLLKLSSVLDQITGEALRQGQALINLVEESDPFSGFARTLLLSQETTIRISELIRLSLSVNSTLFRKVSLRRFMSGFPSGFVERGLRPPSLSLSDDLPQVTIIPEVVLNAVSRLCRLYTSDSVIGFAVETEMETGCSALLKITGLAETITESGIDQGHEDLQKGILDTGAELAFLTSLLEGSGCRVVTRPDSQCTIQFVMAEL